MSDNRIAHYEEQVAILQIQLKNSDLGTTVDETDTLIKRHEAFEKLLSGQEDKVGVPVKSWFLYISLVAAECVSFMIKHKSI